MTTNQNTFKAIYVTYCEKNVRFLSTIKRLVSKFVNPNKLLLFNACINLGKFSMSSFTWMFHRQMFIVPYHKGYDLGICLTDEPIKTVTASNRHKDIKAVSINKLSEINNIRDVNFLVFNPMKMKSKHIVEFVETFYTNSFITN